MNARQTVILASFLGLLGVALGAFGAHGLESRVDAEQLEWWTTAARYQQIHAVALLAIGLGAGAWTRWRRVAVISMTAGVLVFCGTLDAMALGGPRILGAVTPLGGLGMIVGWAALLAHALGSKGES